MRQFLVAAGMAASILLLPLAAYPQWFQGDRLLEDTEWQKSLNGFGVTLLLTDDPQGLVESWNHPPSPDYKPEVRSTNRAHRGDTVEAAVIFMGCRADGTGHCNSTIDFTVFRPDGSEYGAIPGGELWKGKEPPPAGAIQLGVGALTFVIEPDDPLGEYTIEAQACDAVAEVCLDLVQKLNVTAGE